MKRFAMVGLFCLLALLAPAAARGGAPAGEPERLTRAGALSPRNSCAPAVAPWTLELVDAQKDFANQGGRTVVLDAAGHPHVVYGGDHLYYAWYDGTDWQRELVDPALGTGAYASLALDSAGHPHVSYYDQVKQDAKYAYFDGTRWQIQTVDANVSSS